MSEQNPRAVVVEVLLRREKANRYIEELLAEQMASSHLSPADRGLAQELTYGVVRWQGTLDWLISRKTPAGRNQKPALRILLRLALYQLFWLERVPDHAAVNESVALAKQLGFGPQAGFVNAVLRGFLRERIETERLLRELRVTQPPLGFSHPEWLWDRWEARWGRESAVQLLDWNNRPPGTFGRINRLRLTPAQLRERWLTEGVTFEPVERPWLPPETVYELKSHSALASLASFQEGGFYVQDPSTLLAVQALVPRPGDSILDLCAAPGGKTCYLAEGMQNQGRLVAYEPQPERMGFLEENCRRLGASCVQAVSTLDETSVSGTAPLFQAVLVDAPCSNTGVLRRRVDLRWRIRASELERLRRTQLELVSLGARQLRPGGRLVYSTCSLEPEENRGVIDAFLSDHHDFRLEQEEELLPFRDGVDGAYAVRLAHVG